MIFNDQKDKICINFKSINDNNYPTISDLESTNGTYVQDRKIKNPTILNDSDLISIGKTVLLFKIKPDN